MPATIQYEDVHDHKWDGYYPVPNESTIPWRELIKETPIYRAAGICSSGEVGLFGILPLVRRELVLIDHSYRSLQVAALKYLLLREKGAKEAYRLCTTATLDEISAVMGELHKNLPANAIKTCFEDSHWLAKAKADPDVDQYGYNRRTGQYMHYGGGHSSSYGNPVSDYQAVQHEWGHIPLRVVEKACRKLHRVKFIHGDMRDLQKEGPFGLIYLSNALQHNYGRVKARFSSYSYQLSPGGADLLKDIEGALREGGYALIATSDGRYGSNKMFERRGWKLVSEARRGTGQASYSNMSWDQQLWQVKAA